MIANENHSDPVEQILDPFIARSVRIYSQSWNDSIGCKLEWFISNNPTIKLLPQDSLIAAVASGFKLTASSAWDTYNGLPSIGYDIQHKVGYPSWCSGISDSNQWVMVTSVVPVLWRQIGTKGMNNMKQIRITSYYLSYTVDGSEWIMYKDGIALPGNTVGEVEVLNILEPFVAVAIRIYPLTWNSDVCMRLEVWCSEI